MTPDIPFKRKAVEPVQCLKNGWELIKDRYWLFFGIALVGGLIGGAVPLGILLGPMMCGVYLTLFKKRRGEPIEFAMLFKGFDFFGPSLIATLLHIVPILAIVLPAYFLFYISMVVTMVAQGGNDPNPAAMFGILGAFALFWLFVMVVVIFISIGFTFCYPLIVDRKLQGFDAVKLSFKAAMANFWRLLGMSILSSLLLSVGGIVICYFGMFFLVPIVYGAVASAYEQVFGLAGPGEIYENLPPPPPTFE
jgi:hypothetical protein